MRRDREDFRAPAHQENFIAPDVPDKLAAIGKLSGGNALRQIRAGGFGLVFGHVLLLL
jgi:hypothetical protein